jgi:hypothetical protein
MRARAALLIFAVLPLLGGCGGIGQPSHADQPTIQGEAMQHMLADIDRIRAFVYGSGDQSEAAAAAADLVSWSTRMAELFPPGQASAEYVDMSPERVRDAPAAMSRTAGLLQTAVRTGNRPVIGDRLAQTERDGCGVCHRSETH